MSIDLMLRPLALATGAALCVAALPAGTQTAAAQQAAPGQGASVSYSAPYSPPPSRLGGRYQPTPRAAPYGYDRPGIWQGFYLGGHGGYGIGTGSPTGVFDSVDLSGGTFGAHGGYNWQMREWVLGVEADLGWSTIDGSRTFGGPANLTVSQDWIASARLRAGYAFDNMLLYATGGIAMGGFEASLGQGASNFTASDTLFGFVLGGGLEIKLTPGLSARIEGLHYGFRDQTYNFGISSFPIDANVTTVRAGLTLHLN